MGLYDNAPDPEDLENEMEDEFNQDPEMPVDSEFSLMDRFVKPNADTSSSIELFKTKDGREIPYKVASKYKERILSDVTTSNLDSRREASVQEAFEISISIQNFGQAENIDLSKSANFFTDIMHGEANISKGLGFELLRSIKTSRQEANKTLSSTQEFKQPKKKAFGLF